MPSVLNLSLAQKAAIVAKLPESSVTSLQFTGTDGSGNALITVAYSNGLFASYSIDVTGVATLLDLH